MLVRASLLLENRLRPSLLVNNGQKRVSRISALSKPRKSNVFKEVSGIAKQASMISRDSEANLSVGDEEDSGISTLVGRSVHRCSMIKKYSIETFFTPAKQHRRAITTELKAEN